jgi:hypothetical protein
MLKVTELCHRIAHSRKPPQAAGRSDDVPGYDRRQQTESELIVPKSSGIVLVNPGGPSFCCARRRRRSIWVNPDAVLNEIAAVVEGAEGKAREADALRRRSSSWLLILFEETPSAALSTTVRLLGTNDR